MDWRTKEIIVSTFLIVILLLFDYFGNNFPWGTSSAITILFFELIHNYFRSIESNQRLKVVIEEVISEYLRQSSAMPTPASTDATIQTSDTFMAKSILFVEGRTDKMVIEHWAKQLGLSLFPPKVTIISMGGLIRPKQVKAWRSVLQSLNVNIGWVFDGDYAGESAIKLLRNAKFPEEYIWKLDLGSIESYYPKDVFRRIFNKLLDIDNLNDEKRKTITKELEEALKSKEITHELSKLTRFAKTKESGHLWKQLAAQEVLKTTDSPQSIAPLLKNIDEKLSVAKNEEDKLGW